MQNITHHNVQASSHYIFERNFGNFGLTRDSTRCAYEPHPCPTLAPIGDSSIFSWRRHILCHT